MSFIPAHSLVQAPGSAPTKTAFILHGILGHQRNWRSYARSLAQAHPHWRFVLIDLRNHGGSQVEDGPHTVLQTAQDLVHLAQKIGMPQAVIGHSFGGKVALVFSTLVDLEQAWILDALPGRQDASAKQELRHIFGHLRDAGAPFISRGEMETRLSERGLPTSLIQWMTTNLNRTDSGYQWAFHLDNATAMIEDYFALDTLPILRTTETATHLVRAEQNPRWTADVLEDIQTLSGPITLHTLHDAGHWVHIDNPTGLRALMDPHFSA